MKNNIAYSYAHKDDTDNILYSNINNKMHYSNTNINFIRTLSISSICKTFISIHKKGKIFIEKGRVLMGIVDEFNILKENEVFINLSDVGVIVENIMISKNPCLHPGDVCVVNAVSNNTLKNIYVDVVVFAKCGNRPLFNMCSGGDLDGDLYFCSWDKRLVPDEVFPPDTYVNNEVLKKEIVSQKDISNFYIKFMKENDLGKIAYSHLAFSDKESITSAEALKLATLFNQGVDFPKTSFVPRLPMDLVPREYPDFMQIKTQHMYESKKALGILFRRSAMLNLDINFKSYFYNNINIPKESEYVNKNKIIRILIDHLLRQKYIYPSTIQPFLQNALEIYSNYKTELQLILKSYIITEYELFSNISRSPDEFTSEESRGHTYNINKKVKEILSKYREIFNKNKINEDLSLKVLEWYKISIENNDPNDNSTESYKSFGIINEDHLNLNLIRIKEKTFEKNNFIFTSGIELRNKKNEDIEDTIDIEDYHVKYNDNKTTKERIIIYTNHLQYLTDPKFAILDNRIYSELFHIFYALEIINLKDIKFIYDFIFLISMSDESLYNDSNKNILKLKIINKLIGLSNYKNTSNIEDISNKIIRTSLILSFNIPIQQKFKLSLNNNILKSNISNNIIINTPPYNNLTVIGMFDVNDEVYFKEYKGKKSAKHIRKKVYDIELLNSGKASINIYKDDLRRFIVGHLWYRRNNNKHNDNITNEKHPIDISYRKIFIDVRILPRKLYFHSLSNKYIYNNIKIRELGRILQLGQINKNTEYIRAYFYHHHKLVDDNYDTYEENIKENNGNNTKGIDIKNYNPITSLSFMIITLELII